MSVDSYRTPGREVDETEIERARIHEAAETKRKALEETEKTKRARIEELGPAPHILAGVLGLLIAIAGGILGHSWIETRANPPACVDQSYRKAAYNSVSCDRTDQLLMENGDFFLCRCPRATAAATAAPVHSSAP